MPAPDRLPAGPSEPSASPAASSPHGPSLPTAGERAAAGAGAALVALGVSWVASAADSGVPFPPLALGERIIRSTPGDVATFLIETFAENAKHALAVAVVVLCVALGAAIGRFASVGARSLVLAGAGFGLALALAALSEPSPGSAGPSLVLAAAAGAVFALTLGRLLRARPAGSDRRSAGDLSRREALAAVGGAAFALAGLGTLVGRLTGGGPGASRIAAPVAARRALVPKRAPFPAVAGITPEVTSAEDHYVVDINLEKPVVDGESWRLAVDGLVAEPLELSLDALGSEFAIVEDYSVLTCVSNEVGGPLVGNSRWTGVRLADVLDAAGVEAAARELKLTCADGYTVSLPVERARDRSALLALAQNGASLTVEHGYPCRLRVPRLYGMMNAKWIERIELVDYDFRGYWAERGWSDVATVRTQSRIDTVSPSPRRGAPSVVAGVAWAGDRGISRVEVSIDGGRTWSEAELREPLSELAWRQWAHRFTPRSSGELRIVCRATDGAGRTQDARERPPHPSGASGYHEVTVASA